MDLSDIWQEHKKFIITIVGALILLLVGRGVVFSNFDVDTHASKAARSASGLARQVEVRGSELSDLRAQVDALRERRTQLAQSMQYEPDDLFVLPVGETNPTAFCWRRTREMQRVLVDEAARLDITVPEALGLQDSAPNDEAEVRRTLRCLDVIQTVVLACIGAQVRRIEKIQIQAISRKRSKGAGFVEDLVVGFDIVGSEPALSAVVHRLIEAPRRGEASYLQITDPTQIVADKEDPRFLRMKLSVSALEMSAEVLDEESF